MYCKLTFQSLSVELLLPHPPPPVSILPLPCADSLLPLSIFFLVFSIPSTASSTLCGNKFLRRSIVGHRETCKAGQMTETRDRADVAEPWWRRAGAGHLHDLGQALQPPQLPFLSQLIKEMLSTMLNVANAVFQLPEVVNFSEAQGRRMSIHSEPKDDFDFRNKDWVFCHMKQNFVTLGMTKESWSQGCMSHKTSLPHVDSSTRKKKSLQNRLYLKYLGNAFFSIQF